VSSGPVHAGEDPTDTGTLRRLLTMARSLSPVPDDAADE
jgi:hypothetical protein